MREILFRGKRADNGEWIVGSLLQDDDGKTYIVGYEHRGGIDGMIDAELTSWAVVPKTVGQYTELTDKHGMRIFEGDIIENIVTSEKGVVQWFDEHSAFMIWSRAKNVIYFLYDNDFSCICVAGNAYDNPELIGGRTNE